MTLAEVDPRVWWWVARSSGIVAWALMLAAVLWGLALSTRLVSKQGLSRWLLDLHRWLGTLTLLFTGLHLVAVLAAKNLHFGIVRLLVPLSPHWTPASVAAQCALYLLLAIQLTSANMKRISRRIWRTVHYSSAVALITGTAHGALVGTDLGNPLFQWAVLAALLGVVWFVIIRVLSPKTRPTTPRASSGSRNPRIPVNQLE